MRQAPLGSIVAVAAMGMTAHRPMLAAQDRAAAVARAARTEASFRLDGAPNEPAWLRADSITDFRQREPEEGAPASERTVVRFLAAPAGLYVGVWAYDREPHKIVRTQLRRDGDLDADDYFAILLDPTFDRRSGYAFAVNANGALADAEVKGPEEDNESWNAVWDARARVTPEGWTAELFIPWAALRYPREGARWGVNLFRRIRRKNEEVLWQAWRRQQGLFHQEFEGALEGLGPLPPRPVLELRPFALASAVATTRQFRADGTDSVTSTSRREAKLGLDGKLAIGPTLTLDLTANTDFAQVEADQQVVNLTRFPVFFPEKRQFFLEASGIFDFGQAERMQLFHSRRIGLAPDGTPIPIIAGGRLTGRLGAERLGLLAVRTGGAEDAVDLVARLKHDAWSRGYVGGMATAQSGPGVAGTRLAAGADFNFPFLVGDQNLIPLGFVAWSRDSAGARSAGAWRVVLDYPNNWADLVVGVSRVDSGFAPALGFVQQDAIWAYRGAFRFFPRPHRWGVRRLQLMPLSFEIITDLDGTPNRALYDVGFLGAEFESGDQFELRVSRREDAPADTFEIFPGAVLPPGRYGWQRFAAEIETSDGRPVSGSVDLSVGDYYTGRSESVELGLTVRVAPHLITELETAVQRVRLATGRFTAWETGLRVDYAATPRLNSTLFLQWDNESERLAVNARLHWIPRPGSDAYLVWNSAWPTDRTGGIPWGRPLRGALVGKIVSYFRR